MINWNYLEMILCDGTLINANETKFTFVDQQTIVEFFVSLA